jgi:hypothetical protein
MRKPSKVYAVWEVTYDRNRQHKCLGRYRSVDTVLRKLDETALARYATCDGVTIACNWERIEEQRDIANVHVEKRFCSVGRYATL